MITQAQRQIVAVLRKQPAATNAEIAAALGKREKTIENQLRHLYKRLGITGENRRIQLIEWIRQNDEMEAE